MRFLGLPMVHFMKNFFLKPSLILEEPSVSATSTATFTVAETSTSLASKK